MHEELMNAVFALVHRHALVALHEMTGALIAQIDGGAGLTMRNHSPSQPPAKGEAGAPPTVTPSAPTVKLPRAAPGRSTDPGTIKRRLRKQRQQLRQAQAAPPEVFSKGDKRSGGTAALEAKPPATAPSWASTRAELVAEIKRRGLTRRQVGAEIGCSEGSVSGWIASRSPPPNAINMNRILRWLEKPAIAAPADDWPELREQLRAIASQRSWRHADIGKALGVDKSAIDGWLSPSHQVRAPRALDRIRDWLAAGAPMPEAADAGQAETPPPFTLSESEKATLSGHLALAGSGREIRNYFGISPETAEQAAGGAHLAGEIITKIRLALSDGAAAE